MAPKLKIDIVSDVVCPWCAIGYKRLEKAIEELGIQDRIDLEWQPFELNPQMPTEGENVQEHIANKYGSSPEDWKQTQDHMAEVGAELKFTFDYFDEMRIVNTRDAHILLEFAKDQDKQTELKMRLITAYFSERKDVSKRDVLLGELHRIGLDVDKAAKQLEDDDARYKVQSKEAYWQSVGVSSVPTMVFDNKSALTGAQPVSVYKQVLTELLEQL